MNIKERKRNQQKCKKVAASVISKTKDLLQKVITSVIAAANTLLGTFLCKERIPQRRELTPTPKVGLVNYKRNCYMNSVVQCLSHTKLLTKFLIQETYSQVFYMNMNSPFTVHLASAFRLLHSNRTRSNPVSLATFKDAIAVRYNKFEGDLHQDAHEFLTFTLNILQQETRNFNVRRSLRDRALGDENLAREMWQTSMMGYSKIDEMFYGLQRSCVDCLQCGHRSPKFEIFNSLTFPVPNDNTDGCISENGFETCLCKYTEVEVLDGQRKCEKCQQIVKSTKTVDLWRLPHYLTIQLNRVFYDASGLRKSTTKVDIPLNLDLKSWVIGNSDWENEFRLYGVCSQTGSAEEGHYVAYCRQSNGKWHLYDDEIVVEVKASDIFNESSDENHPHPYILFYERLK